MNTPLEPRLDPRLEPRLEPRLDMDRVAIDPHWALQVPSPLALRRKVLPFTLLDGSIHVACLNPNDSATLQAIRRHLKHPIVAETADPASLERALRRTYGNDSRILSADPVRREVDEAVTIGEEILQAALLRQASDIHIDPGPRDVLVRLRVDGRLEDLRRLNPETYNAVLSRYKVLSGMDIAEKRAPQDGRLNQSLGDRKLELRVATLPTRHGERMTLRVLALQTDALTLESLGLSSKALELFDAAIRLPFGLVLVTGPTGSGKSTTLYAALRRLISFEPINVITVEDPIEYEIEGVAQCEVDSADKVSFQKALRSILRHDPDVVMIGEIRDLETADTAIKAALTGHMVFSTLHTNSAPSVITRLIDMGVEPYLIAATLRLAMAQRLVRKLCAHCARLRPMTEAEARSLGRPQLTGELVAEASGCKYCAGRGYLGRSGLFELFPIDDDVARAINERADELSLMNLLRQRELPTLLDDGLARSKASRVSIQDVLRVAASW